MKQTQNKIENKTKGLRERVGQQAGGMAAALGKLAKITALAYLGKKMLDLGMYSTQMALEVRVLQSIKSNGRWAKVPKRF